VPIEQAPQQGTARARAASDHCSVFHQWTIKGILASIKLSLPYNLDFMSAKYHFDCEIFKSISDLDPEIQELIKSAKNQLKRSYAPYSGFYVGAALLTDNGKIYLGCNQENASFPLCICGERVALYSAAAHEDNLLISAMAITASNPAKPLEQACMPCGACRQVIQEYEQRQERSIPLYLTSEDNEIVRVNGIGPLLPDSFSRNALL